MKTLFVLLILTSALTVVADSPDIYDPRLYTEANCTWKIAPQKTAMCRGGRGLEYVAGQAECRARTVGVVRLPVVCPRAEASTPLRCLRWVRQAGDGSCIPGQIDEAARNSQRGATNPSRSRAQ